MTAAAIKGFRLSPQQLHLWRAQPAGGESPYLVGCAVAVEGDLDRGRLARAVEAAVGRHEILRTAFRRPSSMKVPLQVVSDEGAVRFDFHDLGGLTADERESRLADLSVRDRRGFDYGEGPLLRVSLVGLSEREHLLLLLLPALCADTSSLRNLVADVSRFYDTAEPAGGADEVIQYADCAEIFNELIESAQESPGRDYWRGKLDGAPTPPVLPLERTSEVVADFAPAELPVGLDASLARELEAQAQRHGVSLPSLLLACWQGLLASLTGQPRVPVGVASDGRTHEQLEEAVGLFMRYLPAVGGDAAADLRLVDLARGLDRELGEMAEWQDYFDWGTDAAADGEPPFLPFCFRFDGDEAGRSGHDPTFRIVEEHECVGRFKVKLDCRKRGETLALTLHYDSALYGREGVALLAGQYLAALAVAARSPETPLGEYEFIGEDERRRVLFEFNETAQEFAQEKFLHRPFEAQAARTPDSVALLFEDERLTYAELNARANRLAHHLRALGVGPDVPVGICLERSTEMVVALLGILKAGGAYLPLDPGYPAERLSYALADAGARIVLTTERLRAALPEHVAHVVRLDADREALDAESAENPAPGALSPGHLAYVLYTSGSTGKPKGVLIPHEAVSNHMLWMQSALPLTEEDRVLQKTPFTFDASVWEFFLPLMSGAQLVVAAPGGHQDSAYLVRTINERNVTIFQLVPSMLRNFLEQRDVASCRSLRRVFCGGEALAADLQERFFALLGAELYNFYGPTEASIDVTIWPCRPGGGAVVPIGRPIANTRAYVLNPRRRPAPIGVAGELHLGGVGLARGYMRRPGLTAERFIPDPFSTEPGARLYRTGDLCRYAEDGTLEYLGRIDHQVKVRGFRIETGEVEAVLLRHPAARDAVVAVREDAPGDKRLVAYFVADADAPVSAAELRQHLKAELPEYMIPSAFVELQAIPLTPNGKVDRRALPAPEGAVAGDVYVAPRTAAEEIVAGIWSEVLGERHVGVHDNFFDLGGHSLLAMQVISRVRDAFAVELPLRNFFEAPTPAEVAANIEAEMRNARGRNTLPLTPAPRGGALPLSFAQQRLWLLNQMDPDSALYSIPTLVRLVGALDVGALGQAFEDILRRHESLRTTFVAADGLPTQIISDTFEPPLRLLDLSDVPEAEREAEALRLAKEDLLRPFDLARGPLMRLLLLRLGAEEHILLCTIHHIVSDIRSRDVLIRELKELYSARVLGRPASLPSLPVQYADYAAWERESWRSDALKTELAYWKKQLDGAPMLLSLPTDHPRRPVQSLRGAKEGVPVPAALLEDLRALSRREGATMYMTMLAALNVLLLRYTGREDILVGTAVSNRDRLEIEGLIGFFTNTLVIRADLSGNPSFRELLKRVREVSLEAYAHRDLPFDMLVEELQPERDLSYAPVFQVIFAHQLAPKEGLEFPGLRLERVEIGNDTSKYDLNVNIVERPDSLSLWIEYSPDLFEASTIKRMLGHFQNLLRHVVENPDERLLQLPLSDEEERRHIVHEWNDTAADYPKDRCAHELFEEQAAANPDAEAVVYEGEALSYGELNARANRLARHLRRLGVGPESRVGLLVERSPGMVVALLGILKAGGAYLPLDPDLPKDRLAYMLRDAGVRLLLARRRLLARAPGYANDIFCIEDEARQCAGYESENLPPVSTPQNIAYVIYTSGSTGRPKGVMAPHTGLVNYLSWAARAYRAGEGAGSPVHSPLGFDLTVTSLWLPLVSGGAAELTPEGEGVEGLAARLGGGRDYGLVKLTPAHLDVLGQLLGGRGDGDAGPGTRTLVVGGEALRGESLRWWRERAPRVRVVNEYGPTEATVGCCVYEAEAGALGAGAVPIGRPIANTRLFVLDGQLGLTPPGLAGELYVGGDGLTRGYLRRPGLTAERFIPDAYSGEPGARLYRTGDVVRRLAGGDLEYVGRGDGQVKLRGYRVEWGEVEAALLGHEEVREAAAAVHEAGGGDRRLVAYVVAEGGAGEEGAGRWREYLRERLPEYMIPSAFVLLDSLPLTPNGKLDRKALLELEPTHNVSEYVGPRTAAEEVVAGIWAEVLKTGRVGVRENFFALGGHSLLAMQVVSRVREVFGVKMSLRNVFEHPTIEELARDIDKAVRAERGTLPPPIVRAPRNGPLPVSFVQERIWQMAQKEGRPSGYNLAARFDGPLDIPALERALGEVVRRNEVLRTTFAVIGERPFQVINPPQPVSLTMVDLSPQPEAERQARVEQLAAEQGRIPFDLAQGPLLRFTLARLTEQSHVLLFTVAHIVCDHTSVKLLVAEVGAVYAAFSRNLPTPLPELDIQYPDYANWERQWLDGEVYETQVAYWRRQLAGAPPALQLPIDRPRPPVKTYRGAQLHFTLPEELSEAVGAAARREKATVFMVLLAAFKSLLYRYTGEPDMIVGTSAAGRTTHSGVERLVGNFGTPLALRTRPSGDTTYRELLRQVREASLEAYAHQDLTFDRVLEELKPEHDPSYMPLIQVGFVVHSMPSGEAPPPGELKMEVANVHSGRSVYDLSLRMHQTPQGLIGAFEYNIDLFERATLERMVEHFLVLLEGAVADPGRRLADLPLLTEAERARLLTQWGRNAENFSEEFSLGELAEQVGARVLYVLDADLNLVPAGVPGEVYLGDLSSPQDFSHPAGVEFVGDPFGVAPGGMLCKTGLRARFLPGGDLEFLGRAEQHVKVRGYNVDATQIDAALGQHPGVLQSVTRLREATADAPAVLGAYVVCRQPGSAEPEALRDFLKTRLPAYMIPSTFVMVEEPLGRQAAEHNEGRRD